MSEVFVHLQGLCESIEVGSGTRVWAFAHVMVGARVGRECNIGGGSFVGAGAVIGDRCVIKNGVQVWDGVTLASEAARGSECGRCETVLENISAAPKFPALSSCPTVA